MKLAVKAALKEHPELGTDSDIRECELLLRNIFEIRHKLIMLIMIDLILTLLLMKFIIIK